jgi:hypothetical protein
VAEVIGGLNSAFPKVEYDIGTNVVQSLGYVCRYQSSNTTSGIKLSAGSGSESWGGLQVKSNVKCSTSFQTAPRDMNGSLAGKGSKGAEPKVTFVLGH